MSKIGYLNPVIKGAHEELHGEVKTLQMQLKIKLIPSHLKASSHAPDYTICASGDTGADIEIGAAWKKTRQQIGDVILEFLSITIDDPSLPNALNVAAFKKDDGSYEITWRRRQQGQNQAAQGQVAA